MKTKSPAKHNIPSSNDGDEQDLKAEDLNIEIRPNFSMLWYRKVQFEQWDAGKADRIQMLKGDRMVDVTHVYSYNKVMGKDCLIGIGKALNNTNFKILAWYVNEKSTYDYVK